MIEFGILPTLIGRQLRVAQLIAFKDFSIDTGGMNLSPGSFEILELLEHNPSIGQSKLAGAIGLEKSSLVPAMARLEDLGLVTRKTSATDKRAIELRITAKGGRVLKKLRAYVVARDTQITQGLTANEITTLNRLLKKFVVSNG